MKRLISILLGAVVMIGAASFGLQSANASPRNDKKYWSSGWDRHHHRHHRHDWRWRYRHRR